MRPAWRASAFDVGALLLSAAAIAKPPVYDRARAVARNSSTMRELVQSFKYRDRHEVGCCLADADLIVQVPLTPRGFGRGASTNPDAGARGRTAGARLRRLLRAQTRAANGEPGRALGRPETPECCKLPQAETGRIKG